MSEDLGSKAVKPVHWVLLAQYMALCQCSIWQNIEIVKVSWEKNHYLSKIVSFYSLFLKKVGSIYLGLCETVQLTYTFGESIVCFSVVSPRHTLWRFTSLLIWNVTSLLKFSCSINVVSFSKSSRIAFIKSTCFALSQVRRDCTSCNRFDFEAKQCSNICHPVVCSNASSQPVQIGEGYSQVHVGSVALFLQKRAGKNF